MPNPSPVVRFDRATLRFGSRTLWSELDLEVRPGEFLAVLGPNGSGKSSLVKTVLGTVPLAAGRVEVLGGPAGAANRRIGTIPQQRMVGDGARIRGRDLVRFGLDGHRLGLPLPRRDVRERVDAALESVGAHAYADAPVARLSGGEQQRLRVAQAIVGSPDLLLCDEPLLSLDLTHQTAVSALIDRERTERGAAVVFVTHDVNPVLPLIDRVLYLVGGRFRIGAPAEVLTSATLSELYGSHVEVLEIGGRLVVVGDDGHDHVLAADDGAAP